MVLRTFSRECFSILRKSDSHDSPGNKPGSRGEACGEARRPSIVRVLAAWLQSLFRRDVQFRADRIVRQRGHRAGQGSPFGFGRRGLSIAKGPVYPFQVQSYLYWVRLTTSLDRIEQAALSLLESHTVTARSPKIPALSTILFNPLPKST